MSLDVQKLLGDLANANAPASKAERVGLVHSATLLALSYQHIEPGNQATLLSLLKKLSGHKDTFNGAIIESLLFHITQEDKRLKNLSSYLMRRKGDFSEANGNLYSLAGLSFNASGDKANKLERFAGRRLFLKLLRDSKAHVRRLYEQVVEPVEAPFAANDQVVILTRQILMPPHAPTVDTLKFAARLMKDYGKQVLIVATSEASAATDGAIAPATTGNLDQRFVGNNKLDYEGLSIPFVLAGNGVASEESIAQVLKIVDLVKPEMILSVGSPSLIGEAFAHRCFSFLYPTSKGIPLIEDCSFHTWDQPDEEMNKTVKQEGLSEKYLFAQHPGFDVKPPSNSLTRDQFGIPADAFVFVVVGMRLNTEVSPAFLDVLEHIVQHPKAYIAFAGNFDDYEKAVQGYDTLSKRSSWVGFQNDIMAVYNISDAFLNPERKGGGSAIVYALQAGLPVLSLPSGDAGLAAAGFPQLETYDDMVDVAGKLIDDPSLLKQYKDTAVLEAPKFSGRSALLEHIMEEFEKYKANRTEEA